LLQKNKKRRRNEMSRYLSQLVRAITPYVPGEQPKDRKYIKLNTNENPYPPSPRAIQAIIAAANDTLRLYPDPSCDELCGTIARLFGLKRENVFAGNGSDELLAFCFPAFFEPAGRPIFFADVTYSFYPVYAEFFRIPYKLIEADAQLRVPIDGYFQENGGIIIANPNAPTGRGLSVDDVEKILQKNENSVVIMDEAYIDFGGVSAVSLIAGYPNLLIIRTLSKSHSLAGLRAGFAMGAAGLIEGLTRVKDSVNSYTVDRLAQAGAHEAMEDEAYFLETRAKIINTRGRVSARLEKMGFTVIESLANFVFITNPVYPARELFSRLRQGGILVRYFDKPKIDNYLRVTIGTDDEMERFLAALEEICQERV